MIYKIENFKIYPELYISIHMMKAVRKDGLIEPLILIDKNTIHKYSIERFEAFRRIAESLGIKGSKSIIGVLISDLSKEELNELGL